VSPRTQPQTKGSGGEKDLWKLEGSILIVEDDPSILSTVADILEFEGYRVERATNGAEGLVAIERSVPALVLLDMRMPVLDGWDFARILKDRGVRVPILVMTAARDAQRWADEIGAEGYISKPFHLPDLLSAVEEVLRSRWDG
jgi:DNA-binding response OmpR family regulator